MPSSRVAVLSKQAIISAARSFRWNRQLPKWTVIVEGRELPARPLVLEAAGVPPNDPTNSHQAVAILKDRGFDVRYGGKTVQNDDSDPSLQPVTDEFIHSLRGCCKDEGSMIEDREREHKIEKDRMAHE
jgi:hypothetical protein